MFLVGLCNKFQREIIIALMSLPIGFFLHWACKIKIKSVLNTSFEAIKLIEINRHYH